VVNKWGNSPIYFLIKNSLIDSDGRVIFGGNDAKLPYHAPVKKIIANVKEL